MGISGGSAGKARLAYIDWMRGLACLLMFQTHAYDAWLGEEARKSTFFMWSQLGGTLPAPLFLFLAGFSFALVTDKLRSRQVSANQIARTTILRGAQVLGLGLLFRLQQFLFGFPGAPWTDLLRVDVLNIIGLSMILMGVVCRLAAASRRARPATLLLAVGVTLAGALATPLMWTTWRMRWLPWPLESYICGVHTFDQPQSWLFPLFPWMGFAFAGLATGFMLLSDWAKPRPFQAVALIGIGGYALLTLARLLDAQPRPLYPVYDFWHTSPNFFFIRVGLLLMILLGSYLWLRWGAGQWGFSPVIQLGQTSLLVYWVHIEFVYGRFSILPKHAQNTPTATSGLLVIFLAMLLLSVVRTRLKGRGGELRARFRRTPEERRARVAGAS